MSLLFPGQVLVDEEGEYVMETKPFLDDDGNELALEIEEKPKKAKGATKKKPVGLVYIGIKKANKIKVDKYLFKNKGRSYIQKAAVNKCLGLILSVLK